MNLCSKTSDLRRAGLVCAAGILTAGLMLCGCRKNPEQSLPATDPSQTVGQEFSAETSRQPDPEQTAVTTQPTEAALALPYTVSEAGLELSEFFGSTIPNPDAAEEMADNVASIELTNRSGRYLRNAFLTVQTYDDTIYQFRVQDLPADAKVWAFDLENLSVADNVGIRSVTCTEVQFGPSDPSLMDQVSVQAEDLTVTLTNTGAETLENLEIVCRCNFGELYFGGISYCYPVETLAPGEQITIDAIECYMGTAEVVDLRPAE